MVITKKFKQHGISRFIEIVLMKIMMNEKRFLNSYISLFDFSNDFNFVFSDLGFCTKFLII